jgi:cold shock CspA family protein
LRFQGKLTNWNNDKGYGFVEPNGGGDIAALFILSHFNENREDRLMAI